MEITLPYLSISEEVRSIVLQWLVRSLKVSQQHSYLKIWKLKKTFH